MARKRTIPLLVKLLISNGLILLSLFVVLILGKQVLESRTEGFLNSKFETHIDALEDTLSDYLSSDGKEGVMLPRTLISQFGNKGYSFKVYDNEGILVLNSNSFEQRALLEDKKRPIVDSDKVVTLPNQLDNQKPPNQPIKTEERVLTDIVSGKEVVIGTLVIEYKVLNNLLPEDEVFLNEVLDLYQKMIVVIIILAFGLSLVVSRSITKPVKQVIETTHSMRGGNLSTRVEIVSTTKEIVDLKEAINYLADTLEEEDELRKQVTSDMAHEIRTPVNNIMNILEAILDGVWDKSNENLENCYREVIRLSNLVDKLKSIATIEEDNLLTKNERFKVVNYTNELINLFDVEALKKNVTIQLTGIDELVLFMDKGKYAQIVGNLLSNSVRYCYNSTIINLDIQKKSDSVFVLRIQDKGIGIKEDQISHIFERFYRTDKSRNKDTGGLGLGLTITKKIVELYKGQIKVESKVDEGTTFIVELPVIST